MTFLPMIAIFVVFYFLLIRPQQKRAKETKAMLEALQKGDEGLTAGGSGGKIAEQSDQDACVESEPATVIGFPLGRDHPVPMQLRILQAWCGLAEPPAPPPRGRGGTRGARGKG